LALISVAVDSVGNFDTNGNVRITEYTPNRVNLWVETEKPAFLVLGDAYYPKGWAARIAGVETPIFQVNHVLRGIQVTPGNHEVVFEFKPRSYLIASRISSITNTLIWLALAGVVLFTEREKIKNQKIIRRLFAKKDR
ncbi:MAG: hypothetical protein PHC43_07025, partial [Candidatus Marinimicrobia bacterium]|nr:hypothetical protein [Candidatus Neomarinimicrobiota bacterium]